MRKFSAILLLCCFVLYHFGYMGVYLSIQRQLEMQWSEQIFSDAVATAEARLMEVPLSIPYMAYEEEYRTSNTSFEIDGQFYRAIKQRYANDTLQIVYVPDTAKSNLKNTISAWISSIVDDQLPSSAGSTHLFSIATKEFHQWVHTYSLATTLLSERDYCEYLLAFPKECFESVITPPPELV